MKLLLDTHVLFWWLADAPELPKTHRALILDESVDVFVSAISGWEIAIKVKIGKWPEAAVFLPGLTDKVLAAGFEIVPLTLAQAESAGSMELAHRDPFDRLLAAQAVALGMEIATIDRAIARLGCRIVN